jgi:hypothetical protein
VIEFRLLGPVEAVNDGRRIALEGPTQQALLALLVLSPGRVVSVDRILTALMASRTMERDCRRDRAWGGVDLGTRTVSRSGRIGRGK